MHLKLEELSNQTQERARQLPRECAIVAWFGGKAALHSRFIPLESLSCAVLARGRRTYTYREGPWSKGEPTTREEYPVFLAIAPVINHGTGIIVGDDGWCRYRSAGKVHYTRSEVHGAKPVGALRDVLCREYKNPMSLILSSDHPHSEYHRKLLRWAHRMADPELTKMEASVSGKQPLVLPTFLVPKRRSPLKLRFGTELEQWTLHCATAGRWHLPGDPSEVGETKTQDRGEANIVDDETIRFRCTRKGGEFDDNYYLETTRGEYERRIEQIFGRDDVVVPLVPLIPSDRVTQVRENQALYGPVPKREWKLKEFRALPEETRMAAFYLAALTSGHIIDDVHYLDLTHVFGEEEPIVDLKSINNVLQVVENTPRGLTCQTDGVRIDMLQFICYHMRLVREGRAQQKKERLERKAARRKQQKKRAREQKQRAKELAAKTETPTTETKESSAEKTAEDRPVANAQTELLEH